MDSKYLDLFGMATEPPAPNGVKPKATPLEKLAKLMEEASCLETWIEEMESGLSRMQAQLRQSTEATIERCVAIRKELIAFLETCVPKEPGQRKVREVLIDTILDLADDLEECFGEDVDEVRERWIPQEERDELDDSASSIAFDLIEGFSGMEMPEALREIVKKAMRDGTPPTAVPEFEAWMDQVNRKMFGGSSGKPKRSSKASSKAPKAPKFDPEVAAKGIYRGLARELHPDKTQDDAERERRTDLMQQLTRAWSERDLPTLVRLLHVHGSDDVKADGLDDATVEACLKEMRRTIRELEWRKSSLEQEGKELGGGPIPTSKWLAIPSLFENLVTVRQREADEELREAQQLRSIFPDRQTVLAVMNQMLADQARRRKPGKAKAGKKKGGKGKG